VAYSVELENVVPKDHNTTHNTAILTTTATQIAPAFSNTPRKTRLKAQKNPQPPAGDFFLIS
jgi:hypothetical protein